MIGWKIERNCIIERNGKEEVFNVTRLIKHNVWDDRHPDTSGVMMERAKKQKIVNKEKGINKEEKVKPGDIIIFPYSMSSMHRMPVGVGEVMEVSKEGNIKFQWRGNVYYKHNSTFKRGWFNKYEEAGSYGRKGPRDVEWTSDHTEDQITERDVIAKGANLLTSEERLTMKARKLITEYIGKEDWWLREE